VDTEENSDSMYYTNHASDLLNELMVSVEKQVQSEREEIPNFEGTMGALENL